MSASITEHTTDPAVRVGRPAVSAFVAIAFGAAVAVGLGVYGRVHDPAGQETVSLFFKDTLAFKSWSTTAALVLAVFQLVSAARIYGRFPFPRSMPAWYGDVHRLSGTLAFVCTLPVAFHCLWSLGFATDWSSPRPVVHSIAGCFFFGLFATKVLAVRSRSLPGWMLPATGGLVFTVLVVLWATSSYWYFTTKGFPQG